MKVKIFLSLLLLFSAVSVRAEITVVSHQESVQTAFPLVAKGHAAALCYDGGDALVVGKAMKMLAADIKDVTGVRAAVTTGARNSKYMVVAGTIGKSRMIDELVQRGLLHVDSIRGMWERYAITLLESPYKGAGQVLVVAGSDRRGTAYGILHLSELIGQSAWCWWADVPAKKQKEVWLAGTPTVSKSPSVKYRGIFINDEDWGFQPWAAKNFERRRGNVGPRTYAKVCELLLRLKANYLCPAMHPVSTAFQQIAENRLVADSFAIVMGSTHCEPLLLNTASEWDKEKDGPWDYDKNKDGILKKLTNRVRENKPYETVWTLALRGLHDAQMGVGVPMRDKVKMLQSALMDQRKILADNINTSVEQIPQAFTPYKEVLDIYEHGLELPDDVTIIWPDDNFGYLKQVSSPTERKRSGGSGVYYHVSYLGVPHSYLWFSTTPTALMYEELSKVYRTGGDRVWLVNCGDIKGCEAQVSFFLDMAYDYHRFSQQTAYLYQSDWLARIFGKEHYDELKALQVQLSELAFQRKPEYMGWGYWNNSWGIGEKRTDTEFSFANYNEASSRLAAYRHLGNMAEGLYKKMPEPMQASFYELVYYPAKGAELMNRMTMSGQLYRHYVEQQRAESDSLKREVEMLHDSLVAITDKYNALEGGKWRYMMSLRQNYDGSASYFMLPRMEQSYQPPMKGELALEVEGEGDKRGISAYHVLPMYSAYLPATHWVNLYNKGKQAVKWHATPSADWIRLSASHGNLLLSDSLKVAIDWARAPKGERVAGSIKVSDDNGRSEEVLVSVFNPTAPLKESMRGLYVEHDGYVAIPAAEYTRKKEGRGVTMAVIPGIGCEGNKALQIGDPLGELIDYKNNDMPCVEYDFYTFSSGLVDVYTYVLPTFPLHSDRDFRLPEHTNADTKYTIRIDDGSISTPSTSAVEYSNKWYDSVLKNCCINKSTLYVDRPGLHKLSLRIGDPGTVVQKIVIDCGGLRRSYMGPKSTRVK